VGPGPNSFAKKNVWVDSSGRLPPGITKVGSALDRGRVREHAEPRLRARTKWMLASRVDNLDPNMVLGPFVYDSGPSFNHREIDIDASPWGNASDPTDGQFVVLTFLTGDHSVADTEISRNGSCASVTNLPVSLASRRPEVPSPHQQGLARPRNASRSDPDHGQI
jgi:hypothetical protein